MSYQYLTLQNGTQMAVDRISLPLVCTTGQAYLVHVSGRHGVEDGFRLMFTGQVAPASQAQLVPGGSTGCTSNCDRLWTENWQKALAMGWFIGI